MHPWAWRHFGSDSPDEGRFRQDLYWRLVHLRLKLPALRERADDVELLANHFLLRHSVKTGKPAKTLSPTAAAKLRSYHWPGNIRELETVIQQAIVGSARPIIGPSEIALDRQPVAEAFGPLIEDRAKSDQQWVCERIKKLLEISGGNVSEAARRAQMARSAFTRLIRKFKAPPRLAEMAERSTGDQPSFHPPQEGLGRVQNQ